MHFSVLARLIWIGSFFVQAAIVAVLFRRSQFRRFPMLTSLFAFNVLRTAVLFALYQHNASIAYRYVYYGLEPIDYFLQGAVALEIARIVLRPTGTWVRDARAMFAGMSLMGAAIAGAISWWITPPVQAVTQKWVLRCDLFTSLIFCELFVAIGMTTKWLGLGWRNHVMAVSQGLTFYASVNVITDGLESYFGNLHFRAIDAVRGTVYLAAVVYIMIQLWVREPERRPIDPELRSYILALHERVKYDLRSIDA